MSNNTNKINILGISLQQIDKKTAIKTCQQWLLGARSHQIVTINPEFVIEAQKNKEFKEVLNNADMQLIDGAGLYYSAKYLKGAKETERITGVDLAHILAEICAKENKSIYIIGVRSKEVAQKAAHNLKKKSPGLKISGAEGGVSSEKSTTPQFPELQNPSDLKELIERIQKASPDVLMVAHGAPMQDIWISKYLHLFPSVKIAVGLGGTFDYISGQIQRAPKWMRSIGMEWLYRLAKQPKKRAGRIYTAVIKFPIAVIKEKIKK